MEAETIRLAAKGIEPHMTVVIQELALMERFLTEFMQANSAWNGTGRPWGPCGTAARNARNELVGLRQRLIEIRDR